MHSKWGSTGEVYVKKSSQVVYRIVPCPHRSMFLPSRGEACCRSIFVLVIGFSDGTFRHHQLVPLGAGNRTEN